MENDKKKDMLQPDAASEPDVQPPSADVSEGETEPQESPPSPDPIEQAAPFTGPEYPPTCQSQPPVQHEPWTTPVLRAFSSLVAFAASMLRSASMKASDCLRDIIVHPLALAHRVDSLFERMRLVIPASSFPLIRDRMRNAGQLALLGASILSVLFGISAALCMHNWSYLPVGIAMGVLFPVLQSATHRALDQIGDRKPRTATPVSRQMLNSFAQLSEVAGLLALAMGLLLAYRLKAPALAFAGLAWWGMFDTFCFMLLNPTLAGIATRDGPTDDFNAAGAFHAMIDSFMTAIPVLFGVGCVCCAVGLFVGILFLLSGGNTTGATVNLSHVALFGVLPFIARIAQNNSHRKKQRRRTSPLKTDQEAT